jgi:peptidoglycan/xylan/chitin deacetylase (PgdA/CDA1 family)
MELPKVACGTFVALLAVGAAFYAAPSAHAASAQTVVSLTFDDDRATQSVVGPMLAAHAMKGTFLVNSNTVGSPGRLTWGQLSQLRSAGNEIAGHTLDHVNLTAVSSSEARWQICEDRARLMNHGFAVTNFAYPSGVGWQDSTVRSIIQQCGYNSARRAWGLISEPCWWCTAWAETIPPADPYGVLTAEPPIATTTLETIKSYITNAETHGGGWVILVFHDICDGCDQYSTPQSTLQGLLDWLEPRASDGTVVKTMNQVIGGALQPSPGTADTIAPASSTTCGATACSTDWYTAPVEVALSAVDTGGSGLEAIRYTTDGSGPTLESPVYPAPFTLSTTTTVRRQAWDNAGNAETVKSQLVRIDSAAPTSSIACNGTVCSTSSYASPVTVTLAATDNADGSGVSAIRYTLDGSNPAITSTPYTGSFSVSANTTVKYRAWDVAGNVEATKTQAIQVALPPPSDTTPPTSSIVCNGAACASGWYGAPVTVSLTATDDASGVAATRYTLNGSEPTASSALYTGPFTVSTTTTVKFRSWDNAGNVEATRSQLVRIDNQPPTVAITSPANGSTVKGNVKITANAADALSGVVRVDFYVNGGLVGTRVGAPFGVNWQTNKLPPGQYTLTAVAYDAAGNTATSASVTVRV